MKKIINTTLVIMLIVAFASCKDETEPTVDLKLDNTSDIELKINGVARLLIESGNGDYEVKSSNDKVVTAALSGQSITINAVSEGTAVITVADSKGKSISIKVTVSYNIPTESKLLWNGQVVEFDKSGTYGITLITNGVAVTDLEYSKKQYLITWEGELAKGSKTGASMKVLQEGNVSETTTLSTFDIIQASDKGNFIMFEGGGKSGWIFYQNK